MSNLDIDEINYITFEYIKNFTTSQSYLDDSSSMSANSTSPRASQRRLRTETSTVQLYSMNLASSPEKEAAELLIKYLNNTHGYSALEEAVFQKDYRAIDLFFTYGYTTSPANQGTSYSPLLVATLFGDEQMVNYLFNKGARFTAKDLCYLAISEKSIEKINFLKTKVQSLSSLPLNFGEIGEIVRNATPATIDLLLKSDVSMKSTTTVKISAQREVTVSALSIAVQRGDFQIVKFLVEHGVEINAGVYKENGYGSYGTDSNPLTIAVFSHRYDIATHLIEKGATVPWDVLTRKDPKTGYYDGMGALLKQAAADKAYGCLTLLLKSGCPSGYTYNDATSDTILVRAIKLQDPKLVEVLLEGGANPNLAWYNKNQPILPLKIAIELGNIDIVASLIKYKARLN